MSIHCSSRTSANPTVQAITGTVSPTRPAETPSVPFARMPHGLASDTRLSPTARLVACALLFWACDRSSAEMANRALAVYLGVSVPTIERAVRELVQLGYIQTRQVRPTSANMTGRIVDLLWITSPAILPAPPSRSATASTASKSANRGSITDDGAKVEGPSVVMDRVHQPRGEGSITGDGGGPSPVMDKEDRLVKKAKNPEEAEAVGDLIERQRPQANHQAEPVAASPLARALDLAMVDARQAASMADEPINAGPGDMMTPGQREALGVMTEAERGAFERKSPGMRSQILAPFARSFEPAVFERVTRAQLVVPRFVAEAKPVDRSTPGLVAAVAGGDPRLVADLAESLCRDLGGLGDRRRWGAIYSLAGQLLNRIISADDLLDAYGQAMGPKAENRGAVFTTALKRLGWKPGAKLVAVRI